MCQSKEPNHWSVSSSFSTPITVFPKFISHSCYLHILLGIALDLTNSYTGEKGREKPHRTKAMGVRSCSKERKQVGLNKKAGWIPPSEPGTYTDKTCAHSISYWHIPKWAHLLKAIWSHLEDECAFWTVFLKGKMDNLSRRSTTVLKPNQAHKPPIDHPFIWA